jgi:hypothetical protein
MARYWIDAILNFSINVTPLAALAAVIVAIFTLREIRLQRQKTYEPQLFLSNVTVWMQKNLNGTPCILKSDWQKQNSQHSLPFFDLEMYNIGLGAANTIKITWLYNRSKIIEKFEQLGSQTNLLKKNNEGHFEYLFNKESSTGYGFIIESTEESIVELSFLTANNKENIRMPEAIYNYLSFIPYLELVKQNFPRRIELKEEICEIKFSYYDIGGKRHRQRIKMSIELYAFSKEFSENNYALATISFRK